MQMRRIVNKALILLAVAIGGIGANSISIPKECHIKIDLGSPEPEQKDDDDGNLIADAKSNINKFRKAISKKPLRHSSMVQ